MHVDEPTRSTWERLRASRWNPPAPATATDERRRTYVFALEQAEQMFHAATTVGPPTRPLLVFYGLSQAGRAVAAAASAIRAADTWKLDGHGISSGALDGRLPDVEVRTAKPGDSGSFARLSELLDSPLWGKQPVSLNVLWDLLPENEHSPLLDTGKLRRTPLWIVHSAIHDLSFQTHPLASVPVVRFPPWVVSADNGREALDDYLKAFPDTQGYSEFARVADEDEANPAFTPHRDGWGELVMHWEMPGGQPRTADDRLRFLLKLTRLYRGRLYFFPIVAPNTRPLHPLMAWWAVLHTLSMLARYQSAEWASHIDVDSSRYAVAVERLLYDSIRFIPSLVVEAIEQVSGSRIHPEYDASYRYLP